MTTTAAYPIEGVVPLEHVNEKVALQWQDVTASIPEDYLDYITTPSKINPVKNLGWNYYYFRDVSVFSPAANAFKAREKDSSSIDPAYTKHIEGTKPYKKFWRNERKRCLEGFEPEVDGEPCGIRITGEHYFYLNYCRLKVRHRDPVTGRDTVKEEFPSFTAMDYYYFHILEKCEMGDEKEGLIFAKARRKGFSYKNAAGAVYIYSFFHESKVAILSEFGDKARETYDMAMNICNFLNRYTEFRQPTLNNQRSNESCYIRSGWVEYDENNQEIERGKKSVIQTIKLHQKPNNAAGLYANRMIFEEAEMINDLKQALRFSEPTMRDGDYWIGIPIIYGTGGENETQASDFIEMYFNPKGHGLMSVDNIYEPQSPGTKCGVFFDEMWFRKGFRSIDGKRWEAVDESGNAHRWIAEMNLLEERDNKRESSTDQDYQILVSQKCRYVSEAFMTGTGNYFATPEINERLQQIQANKEHKFFGVAGNVVDIGGSIKFKPDTENELQPLDDWPEPEGDKEGCIVRFEAPKEVDKEVPDGAYLMSIDTIGVDDEGAQSLIAAVVMKTRRYAAEIGHDEIVAIYVGRPKKDPIETGNYICMKLAKYYNAWVTFENDRSAPTVRRTFFDNNQGHRLMGPPNVIVDKHIKNSSTNNRTFGHSMATSYHKQIGEMYLMHWLYQKRYWDEAKERWILNLDMIKSLGLAKELVSYRRKDPSFNRVMALMGAVLQHERMMKEIEEVHLKMKPFQEFLDRKYKELPSVKDENQNKHRRHARYA